MRASLLISIVDHFIGVRSSRIPRFLQRQRLLGKLSLFASFCHLPVNCYAPPFRHHDLYLCQ